MSTTVGGNPLTQLMLLASIAAPGMGLPPDIPGGTEKKLSDVVWHRLLYLLHSHALFRVMNTG